MGVRFACHACGHRLNIKTQLAGRRGKCPECGVRFRIPREDTEYSIPLPDKPAVQDPAPAESTAAASTPAEEPTPAEKPTPAEESTPADPQPQQSSALPSAPAVADAATGEATRPEAGATVREEDTQVSDTAAADTSISESAVVQPPPPTPPATRRFVVLDEDPAALWYVRPRSGGQYGPATVELLYEWIGQGRVSRSALLWRDGWAQWRSAAEVLPELDAAQDAPSAPASPQQPAPSPAALSSAAPSPATSSPAASEPVSSGPLVIEQPEDPALAGDQTPGAAKSQRKHRRLMMTSMLLAISLLLVIALIVVIQQSL